jgi:uncharacterized membrane protein
VNEKQKEFILGFSIKVCAWIAFSLIMLVIGLIVAIPIIALEVGLSLIHINPDIAFISLFLIWILYNCYKETKEEIKHKRGK